MYLFLALLILRSELALDDANHGQVCPTTCRPPVARRAAHGALQKAVARRKTARKSRKDARGGGVSTGLIAAVTGKYSSARCIWRHDD